jgi:hypothetical protein
MLSKYYVMDEDNIALRWFYTKAEALLFKGNNNWTIELRKAPKVDLIQLVGEAPF